MTATGSDARQTRSLRAGLSDLLLQSLARITHALILIRIRWPQRPHLRRHLAYLLAVDSGQGNPGLLGIDRRVHARGQWIFNGMRVTEAEHDHPLTLHLSAIADANNFQFTRPALGYAFDRVVDQSPRQP